LSIANPPRGVRIESCLYDGVTTITVRIFHPVYALVMTGFAVLWNGFIFFPVGGIVNAITEKAGFTIPAWLPSNHFAVEGFAMFGNAGWLLLLGMALFFTPFVGAGIWVAYEALLFFFGNLIIRVGNGEGSVFTGIGSVGRTRRFATRSVKSIGGHYDTDSEGGKSYNLRIEMNNGRRIKTPYLTTERVNWLAFALNKTLNK